MYYPIIAFQVFAILAIIGGGLYVVNILIRDNIKPLDYGTKGYIERMNREDLK